MPQRPNLRPGTGASNRHVVRDEDPPSQQPADGLCGSGERRRAGHVRCPDPVDAGGADVAARVDQRAELAGDPCVGIQVHHGDLNDPVPSGEQTRLFPVHHREPRDIPCRGKRREPVLCRHSALLE